MTGSIHNRTRRPIPDVRQTELDSGITIHLADDQWRQVAVVGAGGHGRELADIIRGIARTQTDLSLVGLVDDGEPDRVALARAGFRFLGNRTALEGRDFDVHLGLGHPDVRRRVDDELGTPRAQPLIHPTATVGSASSLAPGVVLAQNAVVTTNVTLGRHTHLNVNTTVSHDCNLGDYVTVCPGATITGAVAIGECVFIGAGATVLPSITIGDGAVIGAGAVVTEDVLPGQTVAGVPALPVH